MSYSKYIRDHLNYSHGADNLEDEFNNLPSEICQNHRKVHDPHVEIEDPDTSEDVDIGVTKHEWVSQRKYNHATGKDDKINRGSWSSETDALAEYFQLSLDDEDDQHTEDDDE